MKREVPVEQAIGMALAHDLTQIVPGEFKGRAFAKGHVIREEDIPRLLDMGKRHIYVIEIGDHELHENDAALRMSRAVAGPGIALSDVHEGKVILKAAQDGVLRIDEDRVFAMNLIDDISITTRKSHIHAPKGMSVAGVRPIPLIIEAAKVERVEALAVGETPVIDVVPYRPQRVAVVTTGSEIATGRIEDKFGPKLREKFSLFGIEIATQVFPGDDQEQIEAAIRIACDEGATIVCVTGGMSVDPDDRSPAAIRNAAAEVISYGTPMLPGSMLMLAYRGDVALFGLPGAVIYDPVTAFDMLLPRVLAGIKVTKADIARHGVGGWLNA